MKHATRLFCATTAVQVNINEFSINLLLLQLCMHTPPTEAHYETKGHNTHCLNHFALPLHILVKDVVINWYVEK